MTLSNPELRKLITKAKKDLCKSTHKMTRDELINYAKLLGINPESKKLKKVKKPKEQKEDELEKERRQDMNFELLQIANKIKKDTAKLKDIDDEEKLEKKKARLRKRLAKYRKLKSYYDKGKDTKFFELLKKIKDKEKEKKKDKKKDKKKKKGGFVEQKKDREIALLIPDAVKNFLKKYKVQKY